MPRPRFARLAPQRRNAILDAAAAEFGEHGFSRASYNRIIERAGLSKGAMYYYFADKQDLYNTVVTDAVTDVFEVLDPVVEADGPAAFWASFSDFAGQLYRRVVSRPRVMMLLPALLNPRPSAQDAEVLADMQERVATWLETVLGRGRDVGAVRDDIPRDLLLSALLGVGEAIDRWVAGRWAQQAARGEPPSPPDEAEILGFVDLLRRVAEPR